MAKQESILVFCAHSDDQIFGPGATLAKYSKQGKKITTIIFSYGEAGLPWLKPEVAKKIRKEESEKADKIIGGSGVVFFDLKEGKFDEDKKKTIKKIQQIVLSKKPVKIFTHAIEDPHPDHKSAYRIVMESLDGISYKGPVYSFDVWTLFHFKKIEHPKLYEDISETFHLKIKALQVFKSQKIALFTLFWSVYVKAFIHGFHIHQRFAERFFKIR